MINIKENLEVLKDTPNYFRFSKSVLDSYSIENGVEDLKSIIEMISRRVDHFSSSYMSNFFKKDGRVYVVNIPNYLLPVSYNIKTQDILLNLNYFNNNDISRIDPRNVYALLLYGISFKNLIENGHKIIKDDVYDPVSDFMSTLILRMFGKQYGIMGAFSSEIPKMRFATHLYVMTSFFGETQNKIYKKSASYAGFDHFQVLDKLDNYDFSKVREYVRFLNDSGAMPGFNSYALSSRLINSFGIFFIPMIEDVSRFFSTMLIGEMKGSSIVSGFVSKLNLKASSKISAINKNLLKGFK